MDATLRPSTLDDLELHAAHRVAMFRDMDYGDDAGRARMADAFRERLRTWLATGEVAGVVAEAEGRIVAGALIQFREALPSPLAPMAVRGYLFNVFTEPAARGRGLAKRMTEALLQEARRRGVGMVELHASRDAERLYRAMGFEPTPEFRLILDPDLPVQGQWKDRR
jgi:GNAT superfamily N-acetyltransferase